MEKPPLGEQQLEVLRFITEHAPVTSREVVEAFQERSGLARTTVLTVIDRLCAKGYLTRRRRSNVYHYSPRVSKTELLNGLARDFVDRILGGSVSPLLAYLASTRRMSDQELDELDRLVDQIKAERREKP